MINIKGELQIELESGKIWFNSEDGICILRLQIPPEHIHTEQIHEPTTNLIIDLKYEDDDFNKQEITNMNDMKDLKKSIHELVEHSLDEHTLNAIDELIDNTELHWKDMINDIKLRFRQNIELRAPNSVLEQMAASIKQLHSECLDMYHKYIGIEKDE